MNGKEKLNKKLSRIFKKSFFDFWNAPHLYNHEPHKGESLRGFKQRVEEVLKKIITTNSDGNILIVTHAVVIRAIISFFKDLPIEMLWKPPFIHGTSLQWLKQMGKRFK